MVINDKVIKFIGWGVTITLTIVGLIIAYENNKMTEKENDPFIQVCALIVDVRTSFLEVGAEASSRLGVNRSKSRDALDHDLRELTKQANRAKNKKIQKAATNARISLAAAFNLPPPKGDKDKVLYKLCLISSFFHELEVISKKCRTKNLPSTPKPLGTRDTELLALCAEKLIK